MAEINQRSELPKELQGKLKSFDKALSDLENKLEPLLNVPQVELNAEMKPIDKAKLDLVAAYSINSLFWMYLNVCGVNPKEHGIKQELDRIRGYMNRVKEVQERENAPKLNVPASKRYVRSALWLAAQSKGNQSGGNNQQGTSQDKPVEEQSIEEGSSQKEQQGRGKKRKSGEKKDKKHKKHKQGKSHGNRYMDRKIE